MTTTDDALQAELDALQQQVAELRQSAQGREAELLIENGWLRSELHARLAEQTATGDILRVIASRPADLPGVLSAIGSHAVRLCDADDGSVWRYIGDAASLEASGEPLTLWGPRQRVTVPWRMDRATPYNRASLDRRPVQVVDMAALTLEEGYDPAWIERALAREARTVLVVPLLRQDEPVGSVILLRREPRAFTDEQIRLLQGFADQAVIAIENARLFSELQESNRTLTQALEQQTATSDILRVIAESTTDLSTVMQTILDQAVRLCGASDGTVRLIEGDEVINVATVGEFGRRFVPGTRMGALSAGRDSEARRAVLAQRTLYHPDTRESDEPHMAEWGILSQVYVPLPGEERPLGFITIRATQPNAFSPAQIALVETFARQAAIAVKNTQLFRQLQAENARKQEELERARGIQQRLLPATIPTWPGQLEIAFRLQPAVETSGDFYDLVEATPTTTEQEAPLQIAVADVAGKGMGAALVMSLARAGLRAAAALPAARSPAATAQQVSDRLHRDVGHAGFVACALATIEPPFGARKYPRLRLVNAGQPPVLLCRAGSVTELEPPGDRFPLGAVDDCLYQERADQLRPGDVVVFSSDGLPEAPAHSLSPAGTAPVAAPEKMGELFGFDRLAQCAGYWATHAESAEAVAAGLWSDITAWCGEESHHDDMTLLVLRVPGGDSQGE